MSDNIIHPSAIIYPNVELGTGNYIEAGAVIGCQGAIRGAKEYAGKISIGNNNRIGANTCIHAGQKGDTRIGDNNIIMGFVNIGHNTIIGSDNEIGAGTIIAGFVKIGHLNKIKLHCTLRNRIEVGNEVLIGMGSNVVKSIPDRGKWWGNPAHEIIEKISLYPPDPKRTAPKTRFP